jgi:[acyl-carrier-protein] S-malonyltransferase
MSSAYVFPGQGAQAVGMGKDLSSLASAQRIFAEADQVLGFSLSNLMFDGPKSELDDTVNTQPALYTMSVALYECLPRVDPAFLAGNSFGEYAALYVSGAFDFADGLKLVRTRGRLMKSAGQLTPGGMAAVIGLDDSAVRDICAQIGGVQVSNYNSPGQVVVSGAKEAVANAMVAARERKAKLVAALDVSIAAHSALMQPAVAAFAQAVNATPMREPRIPVVANVTARPLATVDAMRSELVGQLTAAVQWTQTIEFLVAQGVDTFVEIGSGKVLTGLIKRSARNARLVNVNDLDSVQQFSAQEHS